MTTNMNTSQINLDIYKMPLDKIVAIEEQLRQAQTRNGSDTIDWIIDQHAPIVMPREARPKENRQATITRLSEYFESLRLGIAQNIIRKVVRDYGLQPEQLIEPAQA